MMLFESFQPKPGNPSSEGSNSALERTPCSGKGDRSVTLSKQLLQRCDLGRLLLEMKASSDTALDDSAAASDTDNIAEGESITLSLDAFPESISVEGLTILDSWACADAEAETEEEIPFSASGSNSTGSSRFSNSGSCGLAHTSKSSSRRRKRLSEFVVAHAARPVHLAARAADFLGCEGFLELYTQLQVLRVAMAGGGVLGQLTQMEADRRRKGEQEGEREQRRQERALGLRRRRCWWERMLQGLEERREQPQREKGWWERQRQPKVLQGDDAATQAISISGMLPKLSALSKETIQTHLPLLLSESPLSDSPLEEDDGMDFEAAVGAASSSSAASSSASAAAASAASGSAAIASCSSFPLLASPPPGPWSTARQDVPVHWVEAVAALLPYTDLLPYQATSTQHLRYLLTASGVVAACYAEHAGQLSIVQQGKELFVGLDLTALPEAVRQGYVAVGVEVEAEGHDQGSTNSPMDCGTYNNCYTWYELAVVRLVQGNRRRGGGGRGRSQPGPKVVPVREGGTGRLFTNLHGVALYQQHSGRLGPASQVVQDLNTHVFVAAAGGAAGQQQQQAGAAGPLGGRQRAQKEKAEDEDQRDDGEGDWWDREWWEREGGGHAEGGWVSNHESDAGECPLVITDDRSSKARYWFGPGAEAWPNQEYSKPDVLGRMQPLPPRVLPTGGPQRLQLRLLQCADRPEGGDGTRWRHYMRSGSITLHLRARRA